MRNLHYTLQRLVAPVHHNQGACLTWRKIIDPWDLKQFVGRKQICPNFVTFAQTVLIKSGSGGVYPLWLIYNCCSRILQKKFINRLYLFYYQAALGRCSILTICFSRDCASLYGYKKCISLLNFLSLEQRIQYSILVYYLR